MAILSRIARVRIADTATGTNYREWTATADSERTVAGAAVNITVILVTAGAAPPGQANTLVLNLYNDTGVLIRAIPLTPGLVNQTVTFVFTDTGQVGGSPRAGTVEIAIRATRTSVGTYDVESDGSPNTPGASNTSALDRGWILGTTDATVVLSNVALGGAKLTPAEYDESLFARVILGAALYVARALTVAISGATPAISDLTNSSSLGPWDVTFAGVVDERFPAAVTAVSTSITVPNATLTGLPDTVLTTTNDSIDVDPRLPAVHHYQVDDNVFALFKHDPAKSMLATESGFLATRFVTARTASGVNGLTVTQTLTPVKPGTFVTASSTTATRDGQAGWTELLAWTAAKPGGTWNKVVDITAPVDIDADAYVVGGNDVYTMRISDPAIVVIAGGGPTNKAAHFTAGQSFKFGATVLNVITAHRQAVDTDAQGALAFVALIRLQDAGPNAGLAEYLDANLAWQPLPVGVVVDITYHRVTESLPGSGVYTKSWTGAQTAEWGDHDIFTIAKARVDGTDYGNYMQIPVVGAFNSHGAEDPVLAEDIEAIANAVWNESTGEARLVSSFGSLVASYLDAAVSSRATRADVSGGGGGSGIVISGEVGP